jgi:predicted restriction endonuclease
MKRPVSKYSERGYITKYGSWTKALEAFVEFVNTSTSEPVESTSNELNIEPINETELVFKHKTKRQPSERLKVLVLMRDGNKCRLCGITLTGDDIHFDHIFPWSKGGETTLENLQVLCSKHNFAKGDVEYPK